MQPAFIFHVSVKTDMWTCCTVARGSFTSCLAAGSKVRASDSQNSGLIAASHCHVSCFACHYYDKVWVLFPWTSVTWDDAWLRFDWSWAPRHDFCQHTGIREVVMCHLTPHADWVEHLCPRLVMCTSRICCCSLAPLGTSELAQRQSHASPNLYITAG